MFIAIIKAIYYIILNRNKNITIYILTQDEIDKIDFSPIESPEKKFDIYMGDEKL